MDRFELLLAELEQPTLFIPEWAKQDAVLMVWPTEEMDWADNLSDAIICYTNMVRTLLRYVPVVVLCDEEERVKGYLGTEHKYPLILLSGIYPNDTWVRDYGPISLYDNGDKVVIDFTFNAWGMKFSANRDNQILREIYTEHQLFAKDVKYKSALDTVLEGGSIEMDEHGILLTTSSVMFEPNRNPIIGKDPLLLSNLLSKSLTPLCDLFVLEVSPMEGDDTDGHIDTIARLMPDGVLLYNATDDPTDIHFDRLQTLEEELYQAKEQGSLKYDLVSLPIPSPIYNELGDQLPATYANFLITNSAIIVPIYGDPNDKIALEIIKSVAPNYEVVGVDCNALIAQGGSLHCSTMQIPAGFLNQNLPQLKK